MSSTMERKRGIWVKFEYVLTVFSLRLRRARFRTDPSASPIGERRRQLQAYTMVNSD